MVLMLDRSGYELEVEDCFTGPELDRQLWFPHYLPHWSSRAHSAARYELGSAGLRLLITADQPPWAPEYDPLTKASSLQTGEYAGPVGSTAGQHRFRDGLVVREAQRNVALYTPLHGLFECRARAIADRSNMVALWMIGYEDEPQRSAEICIFEIFGREMEATECLIGMGVHPFGDPLLADDFVKVRVGIDAREPHTYSAEWLPDGVRFYVDDRLVRATEQSPAYPMQFMLDVFEFSADERLASPPERYPKVFGVEWFRGYRPLRGPAARPAAFARR